MYTLYYSPGACSLAVHVLLNELNQPVKLVDVSLAQGKNKDPEFLKVNPRGAVPVLVDDGHVIREGGAILTYLMDKHNSPMLPKSGKERATALQWLMFANATLHPTYSKTFMVGKVAGLDDTAKAALYENIYAQINSQWAELNAELASKPYICGKECSAADILFTVISGWAPWLPGGDKIVLGSNVQRMIKDVTARPSYQQAVAAETASSKAA